MPGEPWEYLTIISWHRGGGSPVASWHLLNNATDQGRCLQKQNKRLSTGIGIPTERGQAELSDHGVPRLSGWNRHHKSFLGFGQTQTEVASESFLQCAFLHLESKAFCIAPHRTKTHITAGTCFLSFPLNSSHKGNRTLTLCSCHGRKFSSYCFFVPIG